MYREKRILKKYNAIFYSNQYKDDYNIYKIREQQDSDTYRLRLNLTDKIDLRRGDKRAVLPDLSIYRTWKNIKKSYRNTQFKLSGNTWDVEFKQPDGSYSILDIEYYFECIIIKHEIITGMQATGPNIC